MRIVIEEPCEHGYYDCDITWEDLDGMENLCERGSRRILPEGSPVISKEKDDLIRIALDAYAERIGHHPLEDGEQVIRAIHFAVGGLVDALAEGVSVGADK